MNLEIWPFFSFIIYNGVINAEWKMEFCQKYNKFIVGSRKHKNTIFLEQTMLWLIGPIIQYSSSQQRKKKQRIARLLSPAVLHKSRFKRDSIQKPALLVTLMTVLLLKAIRLQAQIDGKGGNIKGDKRLTTCG